MTVCRYPRLSHPAVVVGLCAHGLAITRTLSKRGVTVFALEADGELPGTHTRLASVINLGPINGSGLTETLIELANRCDWEVKPVLFLTNDNMIREVATNWSALSTHYLLSWSSCVEDVLMLLDKSSLEARCKKVYLNYPKSIVLDEESIDRRDLEFDYPIMVKPTKPLSSFKATTVASQDELKQLAAAHTAALPFLIQEWIRGPDTALKICAMYLDEGRKKACFVGRKISSYPPGTGQTSTMQPILEQRIIDATEKFFDGLGHSGPVSMEFKEDVHGELFVIEPTVGRTDYFIDACIRNSVDIPYAEYCAVSACEDPEFTQVCEQIWFDTERDPLCFARFLSRREPVGNTWKPIFPYFLQHDIKPFMRALLLAGRSLPIRIVSKLKRMLLGWHTAVVKR